MDTVRNPCPWRVLQSWDSTVGWRGVSILGRFQESVSGSPAVWPIQKQTSPLAAAGEHTPCAKGHCCFGGQELGPHVTPAGLEKPAGCCQGKSMEPKGCLCFPNPLCTVFQKPKLSMVFTTVSVCPAAREELSSFPHLSPTHPELAKGC